MTPAVLLRKTKQRGELTQHPTWCRVNKTIPTPIMQINITIGVGISFYIAEIIYKDKQPFCFLLLPVCYIQLCCAFLEVNIFAIP